VGGPSLYILYRALRQQVERGPVDALSGCSRFSLSEQCLLRNSPDSTPIVSNCCILNNAALDLQQLLVVCPTETADTSPLVCRVLDCDSISQLKSKLVDLVYRNIAFSSRPAVFDLGLSRVICPIISCRMEMSLSG
jgi:plexin A